jgi:hypothetical protein
MGPRDELDFLGHRTQAIDDEMGHSKVNNDDK